MKTLFSGFVAVTTTAFAGAALAQDPSAMGPFTVLEATYSQGGNQEVFSCPAADGCEVTSAEVLGEVYYPSNLSAGPFPLVIFMHGRHGACYDPATGSQLSLSALQWPCTEGGASYVPLPSHRGYDYIGRVLASHGYIVASVGANGINAQDRFAPNAGIVDRAHLVDRHLDLWEGFNTVGSSVEGAPFAADFIGAVDLANVGTMGHSRGGDGVAAHYEIFSGSTNYTVRALLPIAPTNNLNAIVPNTDLGVVLPYCDGDVFTLEGSHFYDHARYAMAGDQSHKFTFLSPGANHNFFNTTWTPECWGATPCWADSRGTMPAGTSDDFLVGGGFWGYSSSDSHCAVGAANRLTATQQRAVGLAYTAAFFRFSLGGERQFLPLLRGDVAPPAGVQPIFAGYHPPEGERLDLTRFDTPNGMGVFTETTLAGTGGVRGAITGSGITNNQCGVTTSCLGGALREVHFDGGSPGLSRLKNVWDAPGDALTNALPAGAQDVSAFGTLQFRAGIDTAATSPAVFSVTLTDGTNTRTRTTSSQIGLNDLFVPPGDALKTTVMNTVRIPLNLFAPVNPAFLQSVTFTYDGSANGTVMISDLAFTDEPEGSSGSFPSLDQGDGKLLSVTGQGVASIDITRATLRIAVPPGQSDVAVSIFDGDLGGHYDLVQDATNTCYRLVTDPDGTPETTEGEEVVAIQSDGYFADGAPTLLYAGPVHASAQNPGSLAHLYRLEITTGPGTPTGTTCPAEDATKAVIQGFKVKASGQVSVEYGEFSFIAADALGSFSSPDTYMASGADTSYDGTWDFFIPVNGTMVPTSLTFSDSDADDLEDEIPGVAAGANAEIQYELFDGNGLLVDTETNVSGNYDFLSASDLDKDDNTVLTNGVAGVWHWRWTNVLTENNIHVWPPVASPPRMAIYAEPVQRVKVTGAQPRDFWIDHPDLIPGLLPIRLGRPHSRLKVKDLEDALCILDEPGGNHGPKRHDGGGCRCESICKSKGHYEDGGHHHGFGKPRHDFGGSGRHHGSHLRRHRMPQPSEMLRDLVAELLVAELNVAFDASRGQDLTTGYVYGRLETIADILAMADAIVAKSLKHCKIPRDLRDDAELVLVLLLAVNDGEVTFVSPTLQPPRAVNALNGVNGATTFRRRGGKDS
jgi:hypothetical protein